jgi:TM2 domain-containing membrane protein YozV
MPLGRKLVAAYISLAIGGWLGLHRAIVGRPFSGLLQFVMFSTGAIMAVVGNPIGFVVLGLLAMWLISDAVRLPHL